MADAFQSSLTPSSGTDFLLLYIVAVYKMRVILKTFIKLYILVAFVAIGKI